MSSKAFTFSASPVLVSNRSSRGSSSTGFGPRSVMVRPYPRRLSLVVRAQDEERERYESLQSPPPPPLSLEGTRTGLGGEVAPPKLPSQSKVVQEWHTRPALVHAPRYVRAPWSQSENDTMVEIQVDMPGLMKDGVKVTLNGNKLSIIDVNERIFNQEIEFVLPPNCVGTDSPPKASLKNGILTITAQKTFAGPVTSINIPVNDD